MFGYKMPADVFRQKLIANRHHHAYIQTAKVALRHDFTVSGALSISKRPMIKNTAESGDTALILHEYYYEFSIQFYEANNGKP